MILCLMRRFGSKNDKVNAPIAGFISALSLAIDSQHRRRLICLLIIQRILDFCSNVIFGRIDKNKGDSQSMNYRNWLLLLGANMSLISALCLKKNIFSQTFNKFFSSWFQMKENDEILIGVWQRMYKDGVTSF